MRKVITIIVCIATFFVVGCAIQGTVSTVKYLDPPQQPQYTIISDPLSLTDRHISMLIENKLLERGYIKASSPEIANVTVHFQYSIGAGSTHVYSTNYNASGKTNVFSHTVYPRLFRIAIVDIEKSKISNKTEVIWLAELHSKGSSSNMSELAPYFIDVIFENFGKNITNKRFEKAVK